ncbi:superoxide dismutase family protein [Endozoicomonas sp. G2_2]|uniref:superoxide dismutase family protein n=1 Tax=Endozoicomonas sp. G2_2 TaxID=2821092 RepID=UPI001ADB77CE|nr:superoxide dismutase family protein [Endozoicomonas sp. G2_2]MBO9469964.1 superoxide dismutase family protein [Endozoicomonas sp. G2_2]
MKSVVSISAAMLLAMSLAACGNNDEPDNAAANEGSAPETNTASENSNAMDGGTDTQISGETTGDAQDSMAADAQDGSAATSGSAMGSASSEDMPKAAVAVLHGTDGNDGVSATIRFTPKDGGLAYTTEAEGLEPGKHGYHLHLYGDCSSGDGKSAGTHFNLKGSSKNPPEDIDHITGDLGDLEAGEDGSATHEGMLDGASLTGAKAIIGRGVIIHAKPNDPSQPPIGAAGSRQACGVVGIAEPQAGDSASNAGTSNASSGSSTASDSSAGSSMESGEDNM